MNEKWLITVVLLRFLGFARNDDGAERELTIDVTEDLNATYDMRIPPSLQRSRPLKKGKSMKAGMIRNFARQRFLVSYPLSHGKGGRGDREINDTAVSLFIEAHCICLTTLSALHMP